MNIYQLKYDSFEDEEFDQSILLVNEKKYTQEQFQSTIKSVKFIMGHFHSFDELVIQLESYGFKPIVTGYYLNG
jgi:hypothetical protein